MSLYFRIILVLLLCSASFAISDDSMLLKMGKILRDTSFRDKFQIPMLVLAAWQSAGKSLLTEILAIMKISHSGDGATTMRPFLFIFRNSEILGGGEYATFNGQKVKNEEIADLIKKSNEDQKGEFSSTEIRVEIYGKGLPNIDMVDLPGVPKREGNEEKYEQVVSMIRTYVAKENTKIVVIGDGSTPDADAPGHDYPMGPILEEIRPNWRKESILLKNKINVALRGMTVDQVNRYFKSLMDHNEKYPNEFLVALNPDKSQDDLNRMSPTEYNNWLRSIANGYEYDYLVNALADIERSNKDGKKVNPEILAWAKASRFGVKPLIKKLEEICLESMRESLPRIRFMVEDEIVATSKELLDVEAQLDSMNPEAAREHYVRFVDDYYHAIISLATYEKLMNFVSPHDSNHADQSLKVLVDPRLFAMRFEDEWATAHAGKKYTVDPLPDLAEFVSTLDPSSGTSGLYQMVNDFSLFGYSIFDRFLGVLQHLLINVALTEETLEELFNCANAMNHGIPGHNPQKGLKASMTDSIMNLEKFAPWIIDHVNYLWQAIHQAAVISMVDTTDSPYKNLRTIHLRFLNKFENDFQALLKNQTEGLRMRISEMIREYYSVVDPVELTFENFEAIGTSPDELQSLLINNDGSSSESLWGIPARLFMATGGIQQSVITDVKNIAKAFANHKGINTGPVLAGPLGHFNTEQLTAWARVHFHFMKRAIYKEIRRFILAQYFYFTSVHLVSFRKDLQKTMLRLDDDNILRQFIDDSGDRKTTLESSQASLEIKLKSLKEVKSELEKFDMQFSHKTPKAKDVPRQTSKKQNNNADGKPNEMPKKTSEPTTEPKKTTEPTAEQTSPQEQNFEQTTEL